MAADQSVRRAQGRDAATTALSALVAYAGLLALTWFGFAKVPSGFVPTQDKQYLVAFAQLPDAASLRASARRAAPDGPGGEPRAGRRPRAVRLVAQTDMLRSRPAALAA